jgi:hypothetical protein
MPRIAQSQTAALARPASPARMRALLVAMIIGTVLVVLIGGLRGVT